MLVNETYIECLLCLFCGNEFSHKFSMGYKSVWGKIPNLQSRWNWFLYLLWHDFLIGQAWTKLVPKKIYPKPEPRVLFLRGILWWTKVFRFPGTLKFCPNWFLYLSQHDLMNTFQISLNNKIQPLISYDTIKHTEYPSNNTAQCFRGRKLLYGHSNLFDVSINSTMSRIERPNLLTLNQRKEERNGILLHASSKNHHCSRNSPHDNRPRAAST